MSNKDSSDKEPKKKTKIGELILWTLVLVVSILFIGMLGFRYIAKLGWMDSFQNTAFYISGLGPIAEMKTDGQKLFSGLYAIVGGIFFLAISAYLLSQIADLELFG